MSDQALKEMQLARFKFRLNQAIGNYGDARVNKALVPSGNDTEYQAAVSRVNGCTQLVSDLVAAIEEYKLP